MFIPLFTPKSRFLGDKSPLGMTKIRRFVSARLKPCPSEND
jgi:hypothetical protein